MDAIGRTRRQWQEEKIQELRREAQRILEVPVGFPHASQRQRMLIMEGLMETLSKRRQNLLQHLEAQYGLDIRQTVERMLSEFTTEMIGLPNISARMKSYQITLEAWLITAGVSLEDRWHVTAYVATLASGGTSEFHVTFNSHKGVGIRATGRPVGFPDSDK